MFVLGLFTTAAYWPGIFSPAMTPRWIALSLVAPALLLYRQRPVTLTRAHITGLAFILWAALTTFWSAAPLGKYAQCALAGGDTRRHLRLLLGSQTPSLRPFFIAASVGMALSGAVSTAQLAGWIDLSTITMPSGLFTNRIPMGEAAAIVLIWLIAERMWWWALLPLPAATLLSDARWRDAGVDCGAGGPVVERTSVSGIIGGTFSGQSGATGARGIDSSVDRHYGRAWYHLARNGGRHTRLFCHGFGAFGGVQPRLAASDNTAPQHAHNDVLWNCFGKPASSVFASCLSSCDNCLGR